LDDAILGHPKPGFTNRSVQTYFDHARWAVTSLAVAVSAVLSDRCDWSTCVCVWSADRYDNEYGYSTRVTDLVKFINSKDHP